MRCSRSSSAAASVRAQTLNALAAHRPGLASPAGEAGHPDDGRRPVLPPLRTKLTAAILGGRSHRVRGDGRGS